MFHEHKLINTIIITGREPHINCPLANLLRGLLSDVVYIGEHTFYSQVVRTGYAGSYKVKYAMWRRL
jgi:hypothetical protein